MKTFTKIFIIALIFMCIFIASGCMHYSTKGSTIEDRKCLMKYHWKRTAKQRADWACPKSWNGFREVWG